MSVGRSGRGARHRLQALVLGLWSALGLGGGCRERGLLLPDSAYRALGFAEDERTVVLRWFGGGVRAYDVEARAELWQRETQRRNGFAFSPRSTRLLLVEQPEPESERATLRVLELASGRVVHTRELAYAQRTNRSLYPDDAARRFDATDDGRWLVAALDQGTVEIQPLAGGSPQRLEAGRVLQVTFEPGDRRLALYSEDRLLRVLALDGSSWREVTRLERAAWPRWITGGLAFVTERGIEVWDGRARRVIEIAPELQDDVEAGPGDSPSRISRDGRWALVQSASRFDVHALDSGARRFSHSAQNERPRLVCDASFSGDRLRAFLCTGTLLDVDLASGRVVGEASFGEMGHRSKAFAHEGGTFEVEYSVLLSPAGRFLSIYREERGHEILRLD